MTFAARFIRFASTIVAGVVATVIGCARTGPAPSPTTPAPEQAVATPSPAVPKLDGRHEFTLRGVVQAVNAAEGEVTVAHEAMPGFMEAMTMPFLVKDRASLAEVEPGEIVTGPMVVDFKNGNIKNYQLISVTSTGLVAPRQDELAGSQKRGAGGEQAGILQVGDVVPDLAMVTQTGASLRLSDLRGKVVALTFIYTRCPLPDFCPAVDLKFADLMKRIRLNPGTSDHVALLSVSFDSAHDTPEVLARHARLRGARPPWTFAVADSADLARVGPQLGLDYYPDRDQFAHNLTTAVIAADGRLARLELGRKWTPAEVARTIIELVPVPARP